jgi:hypothetical protein
MHRAVRGVAGLKLFAVALDQARGAGGCHGFCGCTSSDSSLLQTSRRLKC